MLATKDLREDGYRNGGISSSRHGGINKDCRSRSRHRNRFLLVLLALCLVFVYVLSVAHLSYLSSDQNMNRRQQLSVFEETLDNSINASGYERPTRKDFQNRHSTSSLRRSSLSSTQQTLPTLSSFPPPNDSEIVGWNEEVYRATILRDDANFPSEPKSLSVVVAKTRMVQVQNEVGLLVTSSSEVMGNQERIPFLIVNVNETYLFWFNGQERLCQLLHNMTLADADFDCARNSGSDTQITPPPVHRPHTLVNVTMDCVDRNRNHPEHGEGNWITAVYAARLAALYYGSDFKFQCSDGRQSQNELLLPWFDQYQRAVPLLRDRGEAMWPFSGGDFPTREQACPRKSKSAFLRIDKMAFQIQNDVRQLATTLLGDPPPVVAGETSKSKQRRLPPPEANPQDIIPYGNNVIQKHNVTLDDVAIHLRCGDILGGMKRYDYGMLRFNEYIRWLPISQGKKNIKDGGGGYKETIRRIGIITQPFEKERSRHMDADKADSCRKVTYALVHYLQKFFPYATISIHNGPTETTPLAYARLALANYSFTTLSSFGIFPIIGTFGQGYFKKRGQRGVNPYARFIPDYLENVHAMSDQAEVLAMADMMGKSVDELIEWFVSGPVDVDI
jgi:hypothetical protein